MKLYSIIIFLTFIGVTVFGICVDFECHLFIAITSFCLAIGVLAYMFFLDYKSECKPITKSPEESPDRKKEKEKLDEEIQILKQRKMQLFSEISRADTLIKQNIQLLERIDKALKDKKL